MSEPAARASSATAASCEEHREPGAAGRGRRVAFSFGTFFWRSKRKYPDCGPGPAPNHSRRRRIKPTSHIRCNALRFICTLWELRLPASNTANIRFRAGSLRGPALPDYGLGLSQAMQTGPWDAIKAMRIALNARPRSYAPTARSVLGGIPSRSRVPFLSCRERNQRRRARGVARLRRVPCASRPSRRLGNSALRASDTPRLHPTWPAMLGATEGRGALCGERSRSPSAVGRPMAAFAAEAAPTKGKARTDRPQSTIAHNTSYGEPHSRRPRRAPQQLAG